MKNISKEKVTGIVGTVVFHVLLLILLLFIVMDRPPMEPEAGLSVVMGEDFAMTEVEIAPQPPKPQVQPKPQKPTPDKPLITQNDEESISVDSAKSAELQKEKVSAEQEADNKRREEDAMKKASNLMANAFGKGSSMGTKGYDKIDEGTSGAPESNMETGEKEGSGMGSWNLVGRALAGDGKLPLPAYNVQEEGRVVVTITVDPDGNVVNARIHPRTNTTSQALRTAAVSAAKRARFNTTSNVNNQEGTITYYFRLK